MQSLGGELPVKLIVARHVNERTPAILQNLNSKDFTAYDICDINALPDFHTYINALDLYLIPMLLCGGISLSILAFLFADTLRHVMTHTSPGIRSSTVFILSVYPVIGLTTLIGMLLPRSQLLMEAVNQGTLMTAFYQLFCLFIAYSGGEMELVKNTKPILNTRVTPCCCWPCCKWILPTPTLNRRNLQIVRTCILQMPLVQITIYLILLTIWIEDKVLYDETNMFIGPFTFCSIILGLYATNVAGRTLSKTLTGYNILKKTICLQLALICSKLQQFIVKLIGLYGGFGCIFGLSPSVICFSIYYMVLSVELVLISIWVRRLYKHSIPDSLFSGNSDRTRSVNEQEDSSSFDSGNNVMYIRNIKMVDEFSVVDRDNKQYFKEEATNHV